VVTCSDTVFTLFGGVDSLGSEHVVKAYVWTANEAVLVFNLYSA